MYKKKVNRIVNEIYYWAIAMWFAVGITGVLFGCEYVILKVIIDLIYG